MLHWRTAAVGLLLALTVGCDRQSPPAAPASAEVAVEVAAPIQRELPRSIRATGTLHGHDEVVIAAKVAGRIVEVVRDLGDRASAGDALIRIDPIDYELAQQERRQAFQEALARLGLMEMPEGSFNVSAVPSVQRSELQVKNARAKLDRARTLFERQPPLISEQDFDDLETAWEVAQSNMQVERLNAESTLAEARTLKAQVHMAEQRVNDTVLKTPDTTSAAANHSPVQYDVSARMVSVGDYVQIGNPLMRLVVSDPLKLRVSVTERRMGAVRIGQPVAVRVEAFQDAFSGRVSRVSPAVDVSSRSFLVEIEVSNTDHRLKPGSFANAQIETAREPAIMVPHTAVLTFAGIHKLLLVREGKVVEQRVTLGDTIDDFVEIREGLSMNDQVIASPAPSLTNGMPVRITPTVSPLETANRHSEHQGIAP